jgi:hypothetical protein
MADGKSRQRLFIAVLVFEKPRKGRSIAESSQLGQVLPLSSMSFYISVAHNFLFYPHEGLKQRCAKKSKRAVLLIRPSELRVSGGEFRRNSVFLDVPR